MVCEEACDWLDPYIDAELDAKHADALEAHLATCAACSTQHARALELRALIRQHAARYAAPEQLRRKIMASLRARKPSGRLHRWVPTGWLQFGGALAMSVLLTSLLTYYSAAPSRTDALVDDVVATHVRSLVTNRLTDVQSSDRHTVRPWFNGKLDFSPPVADLQEHGFPLVGGRLDYLDGRPIAALLYRRRQHWISVFIWPTEHATSSIPRSVSKRGYDITQWSADGLTWFVVSDIAAQEQDDLVALLRNTSKP